MRSVTITDCRISQITTVNDPAIKIFPNPVIKNSSVKLEIKKPGEYSVQILDNTSKLILTKGITTVNKNFVSEINIPSSLAAGMYYIRLIEENKKKQYTDKLIVQ